MRTKSAPPLAVMAALVCVACGPAAAQWLHYSNPGIPRLADGAPNLTAPAPQTSAGQPDLSGIWQVNWPAVKSGGFSLTNLAADLRPGEIAPWAEDLFRRRTANFIRDFPGFRCLAGIGPLTSLGMLGRDLPHFVTTTDDRKRFHAGLRLPTEVLGQYEGLYQYTGPEGKASTYTITRAGDQLMIQAPAVFPGKFALTPQSETKFAVFSAYLVNIEIEFFRGAQGKVAHLLATGLAGGAEQKAVRRSKAQ
jgi:hypothetical protein